MQGHQDHMDSQDGLSGQTPDQRRSGQTSFKKEGPCGAISSVHKKPGPLNIVPKRGPTIRIWGALLRVTEEESAESVTPHPDIIRWV